MSMSSGAVCEWQVEEPEVGVWEPQPENQGLTDEVDRAKDIIATTEEDDDVQISSLDTLARAEAFVVAQSAKIQEICGIIPAVPSFEFGPARSIDLHWKRNGWELLVNIPADSGQLASFYGDDYGEQRTKGTFNPKDFNYGIAMWLMED
jgi:hypothetical protein